MATPGYPQMGQMQGMHPQGMPPQMQMPPQRPIKRGTSRAVPVVVSAGLAVGVFCGLLFGLGLDKNDASAGPAKGNNVKVGDETAGSGSGSAGLTGLGATAPTPPPAKAGSGSGSAPVVVAKPVPPPPTVPVAPVAKTVKLTIEITPDAAASVAKIVVDGKEITGKMIELPLDKKSVKLAVTATGFHSNDKKVDIAEDADMKVSLEMVKRASGTGGASPGFGGPSSGGNHVPTVPPSTHKKPPPGSGIIDI